MNHPRPRECPECGAVLLPPAGRCPDCGRRGRATVRIPPHVRERPLPTGTRLRHGSYVVLRVLRRNIDTFTYLGLDRGLERKIVIREFHPPGTRRSGGRYEWPSADQEAVNTALERFFHRARIIAGIRHEAIPNIYNLFATGGTWYLIREYFPGKTLAAVRERFGGRLPPKTAGRLILPAARAVADLHAQGYFHGNLRPETILYRGRNRVALLGLDALQPIRPSLPERTLVLNPGFAPSAVVKTTPERYRKDWDLYALGATMYTMITGQRLHPPGGLIRVHAPVLDTWTREVIADALKPVPKAAPNRIVSWITRLETWLRASTRTSP